jgi:hypothetical protein
MKANSFLSQPKFEILPEEISDIESFLISLAMPNVGKRNLNAIWERSSGMSSNMKMKPISRLAQKGVDIATIVCRRGTKGTVLHLIHNRHTGNTIIVGTSVGQYMEKFLKNFGIVYIDRSVEKNCEELQTALKSILVDTNVSPRMLAEAFMVRNKLTETGQPFLNFSSTEQSNADALEALGINAPPDKMSGNELNDQVDSVAWLMFKSELSTPSFPVYIHEDKPIFTPEKQSNGI